MTYLFGKLDRLRRPRLTFSLAGSEITARIDLNQAQALTVDQNVASRIRFHTPTRLFLVHTRDQNDGSSDKIEGGAKIGRVELEVAGQRVVHEVVVRSAPYTMLSDECTAILGRDFFRGMQLVVSFAQDFAHASWPRRD